MTTEEKLKEFFKWVMEASWRGYDIDGSDVQEKAAKLGLIVKVPFDPEKHGGAEHADFVEPGEEWFELAPEVKT